MSSNSKIKQIDDGLSRWYQVKGVPGYYNSNDIGKFVYYCRENGIESSDLEDEFDAEPEDCSLVEYDEKTCPIKDDANALIKIIRHCYDNEGAYEAEFKPLKLSSEFWTLPNDKQSIQNTRNVYQKSCKTLFDDGMNKDLVVVRVLAVGLKNEQPYLQFLTDMYLRDRLINQSMRDKKPAEWALTNKHCIALKQLTVDDLKEDEQPYEVAIAAVNSFFHRICPKIMFNQQAVIRDSLEQTAEYITWTVEFVHALSQKKESSCPFQFDFSILMNEAKSALNTEQPVDSGDDED
eukprot:216402_1